MDVLTSSEFRKRYATLERLTVVTVNGHPIGKWTPVGYADEVFTDGAEPFVVRDPALRVRPSVAGSFGHPRPAPKPGKG